MSNRVIEPANGHTITCAFELQDAVIPITANEDNFVPVVLIAGEIHAIKRITFDGNHSQLIIETEPQGRGISTEQGLDERRTQR